MKVTRIFSAAMLACLAWTSATKADTIRYMSDDEGAAETQAMAEPCSVDYCNVCDDTWTLNLIAPSDHCFDCFISPMTNPVYFEDPRTLSEARFIYARHKVPITAGGGEINVFALQLRAAINDRLSIIATKDGFLTSSNPLINDGWADVNVGLKYNLFKDPASQRILSTGVTYELPVGSTRALQGNGDGVFHLFMTGGTQIGNNGHWISAGGWVLPTDPGDESQWMYWSNHLDRRLGNSNFYGFYEANWYHWLDSGAGGIPGIEGGDFFNFGSTNVTGNDIITNALGVKYKPSANTEVGVAWEVPVTKRRDVLDNRLTFDFILRY